MDRSGYDSENTDGDGIKDDERAVASIVIHAHGRVENKFSGFKFLGRSTTKEEVSVNRGIKAVDGSSSDMEHGNGSRE
ncbi:hypothetical protein HOY82DRAFT_596732 [Tuber indicum]|nr:hypothetical protein HOY82DRAFT_596732 [Tuber indicum]